MDKFSGDTPYSIMFGPDICGYSTRKVGGHTWAADKDQLTLVPCVFAFVSIIIFLRLGEHARTRAHHFRYPSCSVALPSTLTTPSVALVAGARHPDQGRQEPPDQEGH